MVTLKISRNLAEVNVTPSIQNPTPIPTPQTQQRIVNSSSSNQLSNMNVPPTKPNNKTNENNFNFSNKTHHDNNINNTASQICKFETLIMWQN